MYKYKNLFKAAMTFIAYTLFANYIVLNTQNIFEKQYIWTVLIVIGAVIILFIAKGKFILIDKNAKND